MLVAGEGENTRGGGRGGGGGYSTDVLVALVDRSLTTRPLGDGDFFPTGAID